MNVISRRKFIYQTGAFIGLAQLSACISSELFGTDGDDLLTDRTFHHLTDGGADLFLHFINLRRRGRSIVPQNPDEDSYLVVQLPPQSLHDQYLQTRKTGTPPNETTTAPNHQLQATLAGPSFLAFRLWPDPAKGMKRRIDLDIEALLDWENTEVFELMTADKEEYAAAWKNLPDKNAYGRVTVEPKALGDGRVHDLRYYRSLMTVLLLDGSKNLTVLELPAGLITTPIDTMRNDGLRSEVRWRPIVRQNGSRPDRVTVYQQCYTFERNGLRFTRHLYERWNAEIVFQRRDEPGTTGSTRPIEPLPSSLPPALRAIGIITRLTNGPEKPECEQQEEEKKEQEKACCTEAGRGNAEIGYLPTLLDAAELVYLNQLGKKLLDGTGEKSDNPFSCSDFDMKVNGPFLLTGLGASLKFHYKNRDTAEIPDGSVSLVEYEHHFQDGRDNFIKVSRIGVVCPTATKALHVAIAQRRIRDGVSFLEYKEYIEFLDREKDYAHDQGGLGKVVYAPFEFNTPIPRPEVPNIRQFPFTRAEILIPRTPDIEPPKKIEDCDPCKQGLARSSFWVYGELRADEVGRPQTYNDLIKVPIQFYDANGTPVGAVSHCPILFFRRDFFCEDFVKEWLKNDSTNPSAFPNNDDQRIRIPVGGRTMALTPDDPSPDTDHENKINQMPTEWVEYFIDLADPAKVTAGNVFDKAPFPLYPQLRRAKTLVDHVQQYGRDRLPSVVCYDDLYLAHGLVKAPLEGEPALSQEQERQLKLKVVLRHTGDFMSPDGLVDLRGIAMGAKLDADLQQGWKRIDEAFSKAGERIGGLVNPDPLLERFALSKSALSLPGKVDRWVDGIPQLDPQALFGKLNAELFCGIRLKDVLQVLGMEEAPQYLLNKVPDLRDPMTILGMIGQNRIVQEALQAAIQVAADAEATIQQLEKEVREGKEALKRIDDQLKLQRDELLAQVPDSLKLLKAARAKLEIARSVYSEGLNEIERQKAIAVDAYRAFRAAGLKELNQLNSDADKLVAEVQRFFDDQVAKYLMEDFIKSLGASEVAIDLQKLSTTLTAHVAWGVQTYLLLIDVKEAVKLYEQAGKADAAAFCSEMAVLTRLSGILQERLTAEEKALWSTGLQQVEMLRRLATEYYSETKKRVEGDLNDILATAVLRVEQAEKLLKEVADLALADATNVLSGWTDPGKIEQALKVIAMMRDPERLEGLVKKKLKEFEVAIYAAAKRTELYQQVLSKTDELQKAQVALRALEQKLLKKVHAAGKNLLENLESEFNKAIANEEDAEEVRQARAFYTRLVEALRAIRHQELMLDWSTTKFQPADLGFVQFQPSSAPPTRLEMKVRGILELDPFRVPPAVVRTEVRTETVITDFNITFFNLIGIRFAKLAFVAGTNTQADVKVEISDVVFMGGLSFIQLLQKLLSRLFNGLRTELGSNFVAVGYQSPPLDIPSLGFTFLNFTVGMRLVICFDRTPLRLHFQLAEPDKKATIAAGIYGGCFFCAVELDTKNGLVSIDMALEMGAFIGISFGPFRGHVKFMVGLHYKKDAGGVFLEGYLIAEGVLSVWVISVCARLYMGVRSQNSYVEGFCVASYSVRLGFFKKTFTATYTKRVSGAASNAPMGSAAGGRDIHLSNPGPRKPSAEPGIPAMLTRLFKEKHVIARPGSEDGRRSIQDPSLRNDDSEGVELRDLFVDEFQVMDREEFASFKSMFF